MVNFIFTTSDNQKLEVDENVIQQFEKIKPMFEDKALKIKVVEDRIKAFRNNLHICLPVPDIESKTLVKIIEYYAYQSSEKSLIEKDLKKFEDEFIRNLDNKLLLNVALVADKYQMRKLYDLTTRRIDYLIQLGASQGMYNGELAKLFQYDDIEQFKDILKQLLNSMNIESC